MGKRFNFLSCFYSRCKRFSYLLYACIDLLNLILKNRQILRAYFQHIYFYFVSMEATL